MTIARTRCHAAAGFSFVELVMYILIVSVLAGAGAFVYTRWIGRAKLDTTKTNLRLLKTNVDMYHTENNNYHSALSELAKQKFIAKVPKDGWGADFRYKVTAGAKEPYELYSYGPDGARGTKESRISAWDL